MTQEDRALDPGKLIRIASLAREVLDELRKMAPNEATAGQLASLYGRVEEKLGEAMPTDLYDELKSIDLDLNLRDGATTEDVRLAYSGLIGWLGGLFQGLQASAQTQTMIKAIENKGELAVDDPDAPAEKEGYL